MYFSHEDIEQGLHWDFLKVLLDYNQKSETRYNEIHIYPEDRALIIEWSNKPYKYDDGKFVYVRSDDQKVMTEYFLPDNSSGWFDCEEEYSEYLNEWLKENPGWIKTNYGTWSNEIENEAFRKQLKKEKENE